MRRTKHAGKVDDNQKEIVAALRKAGCSVLSLATLGQGCPDILIGTQGRNILAEIKDGAKSASRRKLTADEIEFSRAWNGQWTLIESVDDALRLVAQ